MGQLTFNERIAAPVDRVFLLASDFGRAAEHIDGIDKCELLTDGPVGIGTRWRETRTMMGREASEEMEVTAFDPPTDDGPGSYVVEAESCGSHYWTTYRFDPDPADSEATLVTLEWRWNVLSLFARLMSPLSVLLMGSVKKMIQQDLADLKRAAESS